MINQVLRRHLNRTGDQLQDLENYQRAETRYLVLFGAERTGGQRISIALGEIIAKLSS